MAVMKESIKDNDQGIKQLAEIMHGMTNNTESRINGLADMLHKILSIVMNTDVSTTQHNGLLISGIRDSFAVQLKLIESKMFRLEDMLRKFLKVKVRKTYVSTTQPSDVNISDLVTKSDIEIMFTELREFKVRSLSSLSDKFHKFEKTFSEKLDMMMNNTCMYFDNCEAPKKVELTENLKLLKEMLAKGDEKETPETSVEYGQILMKSETILKEVTKGHSMISDSLSAITSRQTDLNNTIAGSCYNIVFAGNKCCNISAQPGNMGELRISIFYAAN
jgi:hypothetical protein